MEEKGKNMEVGRGYRTPEEILELREKYLLPAVMKYYSKPVHLVRGYLAKVWDHQGKEYIDGFSAVVTISCGHCHPDVISATIEQMKKLQHITTLYMTESVVELGMRMAEITPGRLQKSFFTNSGTEATEMATLLCKNYTRNQEFVALRHSFHGRTLMSMSLTGQSLWRHSLPYVYGISIAPSAYCYRCPYRLKYPGCDLPCATEVEEVIKYSTSGRIAGYIAEPIQGFGGVIDPPPEYFRIVYDIVKKYDGIFISDEVQTGFGRTGDRWFGIERWGVVPDMITMAKGMGNGIPVGGVITTPEIAEKMRGITHFSTYGGNPVSCVQAKAVIDTIEKYDYKGNAARVGKFIKDGLLDLKERYRPIGDVRGKGLMLGFELVKDRKTREPAPEEALGFMELCKERGLLVGKGGMAGNTIRIKPPLCITMEEAGRLLEILDDSFKAM